SAGSRCPYGGGCAAQDVVVELAADAQEVEQPRGLRWCGVQRTWQRGDQESLLVKVARRPKPPTGNAATSHRRAVLAAVPAAGEYCRRAPLDGRGPFGVTGPAPGRCPR